VSFEREEQTCLLVMRYAGTKGGEANCAVSHVSGLWPAGNPLRLDRVWLREQQTSIAHALFLATSIPFKVRSLGTISRYGSSR
jgi:hypothetical protein